MAWIYLAVSEGSQKPWKATLSQSPIVKTTDMLKGFCFHEWQMDQSLVPPYGTTLEHSKAICFPFNPISSMEDSPARTSAWRAAERAWKESEADYFSRSLGSLARYDPDSSSWRTSQLLLDGGGSESLVNLPPSGMTVDGEFYPLPMWERRTDEIVGGYWPTVTTMAEAPNKGSNKKNGPRSLMQVAKEMWPTPTVNMVSGGANHSSPTVKAGRHGINLKGAVMKFPTPKASEHKGGYASKDGEPSLGRMAKYGMWPTPTVQDSENDGGPSQFRRDSLPLNAAVKLWPTPQAGNNEPQAHGAMSGDFKKKFCERAGIPMTGQLNPTWVEWLMGYPPEWTALEDWATQWFRPKREKRLKG